MEERDQKGRMPSSPFLLPTYLLLLLVMYTYWQQIEETQPQKTNIIPHLQTRPYINNTKAYPHHHHYYYHPPIRLSSLTSLLSSTQRGGGSGGGRDS